MKHRSDMLQRVSPIAFAQGVYLLLGAFQNFRRCSHLGIYRFFNVRSRFRKASKHGLLPDNVGVSDNVCRCGCDFHQLHDVVSGIITIHPQLPHFVQNRNRVYGLGEIEHGVDRLINLPVLL